MMPTKEERQWRNDVIDTIGKIIEVRPHIHRMILTTDRPHRECPLFEGVKWEPINDDGKYKTKAHMNNKYGRLTVFKNRKMPYYPALRIETNGSNLDKLIELCEMMPELRISSVELALDFICEDSSAVSDVFFMLHHYTYFPSFTQNVSMEGGDFTGWKDTPDENRVFKAWNKVNIKTERSTNDAKIYERGPDDIKQKANKRKDFWNHKDTDRVRIEVRLKRRGGNSKLKVYNIHQLANLLSNSNFDRLFPELFRFSCFTGKGYFKEHEEYQDKRNSKIMSFQELYIESQNRDEKPASRIAKAKHTKPLEKKITLALREFTDDLNKQISKRWGTPRSYRRRIFELG